MKTTLESKSAGTSLLLALMVLIVAHAQPSERLARIGLSGSRNHPVLKSKASLRHCEVSATSPAQMSTTNSAMRTGRARGCQNSQASWFGRKST